MLKVVILLSVLACALGAAVPDGMLPQLDGRIVGGSATTISSYPYQISLQRGTSHSCGGSILDSTHILTAAHCVKGATASTLRIRAGSSYWASGGVTKTISSIKIHEGYNSNTMVNDVAVLKLSSALTLGSDIKSIGLASSDPSDGAAAVVTGWGTTSSGGSIPSQLRVVTVQIISRSKCYGSYGYTSSQITSSMICAAATGKDSCQGDSGGPLVSGSTQVGVVSWGYGCAQATYPGVYADVPNLRTWINNAVKSL